MRRSKEMIGWMFMAFSLIMLVNSIRLCLSSDIWYDELFTMGMVEHSYGELINFTARDVHPPLYYMIAKLILDLCKLIIPSADSVMIVKIVSVMPYFLLLIYAVTFLKKRFGIFVSGVFMFCILAMPQMSAYTVEMRMYGWALFFVTATFFHAYEIVPGGITVGNSGIEKQSIENNKINNYRVQNYVAIILYGLAAAYTQYFACIAVIMVYLYLLVWFVLSYSKMHDNAHLDKAAIRNLKGWLACVVISIIGYLPWLFVLISQITAIRDNYWILPLTWRSIGGCVKFLMKPAYGQEWINVAIAVVLFLTYVSMLAAYGFSGHRNATFFYALAGCLVLCGLVIFGFIASIVIRPIFVYRYMLPAVGCFWLCFALCLDNFWSYGRFRLISYDSSGSISPVSISSAFSMIILIIILMAGLTDYRAFMGEEEYRAVLMQETKKALSDIEEDDIILYNFDQLQAVCGYYMDQESYLWNAMPEQLIIDMFGNKGSIQDTGSIGQWLDDGRNVWFFGSFNSREDIREEWEQDGINTEEIGSYMLERYWFNIYKVGNNIPDSI